MALELTTEDEARNAIQAALLHWRAEGQAKPVMPVYADLDGDGIADYWGLDDDGELIVVSGDQLGDYTAVNELDQPEVGP